MQSISPWVGIAGLLVTIITLTVSAAFWAGRVSQRITTIEKTSEGSAGLLEKVVTLEVEMKHANASLEKVGREMEGVNRQLGNLAMGHIGRVVEIPGREK